MPTVRARRQGVGISDPRVDMSRRCASRNPFVARSAVASPQRFSRHARTCSTAVRLRFRGRHRAHERGRLHPPCCHPGLDPGSREVGRGRCLWLWTPDQVRGDSGGERTAGRAAIRVPIRRNGRKPACTNASCRIQPILTGQQWNKSGHDDMGTDGAACAATERGAGISSGAPTSPLWEIWCESRPGSSQKFAKRINYFLTPRRKTIFLPSDFHPGTASRTPESVPCAIPAGSRGRAWMPGTSPGRQSCPGRYPWVSRPV